VTLARAAFDAIVAHARHAVPRECCGLLIGARDHVSEAVPADNLATDPNRFFLDPRAHIAARRGARARNLEILGFYHSHPHSAPVPSATDIAEAYYADAMHLIVSLEGNAPAFGMFRLGPEGVIVVPCQLIG
jgi:proteasome lid subunit RPN8/RPN11